MKHGIDYAEFEVVAKTNYHMYGVVPSTWDPTTAKIQRAWEVSPGLYDTSGRKFHHRDQTHGGPTAEVGDTIGILLDLEKGSIAAFKNRQRIEGLVAKNGVRGPLCWFAEVCRPSCGNLRGSSASTVAEDWTGRGPPRVRISRSER